jgi:hypothetical protein
MQAKDMSELLKWAHRASRVEQLVKLHTARLIVRGERAMCVLIGCRNRESNAPCPRCGAR